MLLAVPLFILAADLMNSGSPTDRLLGFCLVLVGRFRGGLGHVNVVANIIFAGMSGSAIADAVGIGRVIIGMMTRDGKYPIGYAAAITASAIIIGPIIPPSIPMVVYALVSDASIGYPFLGGVVPGADARHRVHGHQLRDRRATETIPPSVRAAARGAAHHARRLPGPHAAGRAAVRHLRRVMTPPAGAAAGVRAASPDRDLPGRCRSGQFYNVVLSSARATTSVGMLIAGALVFNYVVTIEQVPLSVQRFIAGYQLTALGLPAARQRRPARPGCLLEGTTILLVIVPIPSRPGRSASTSSTSAWWSS